MKNFLAAILILIGITSYAQSDTLTAEQAKVLINKEVIVKGNIAGTRLFENDGKKLFLINLDKRYPQTPLTVVLQDAAYRELNLKEEIEDKTLIIKGIITLYKDKPQIIVTDLKNLTIKD